MALQAQDFAASSKVIRLAEFQVAAQSFEITQYDILLAGVYAY